MTRCASGECGLRSGPASGRRRSPGSISSLRSLRPNRAGVTGGRERSRRSPATRSPHHCSSELAGLRDYYGYLAADRVQLPYDLQAHPTPADPAVQSALAMRPGLIRAHELFECGLTDAAGFEWAVALQGATNAQRIQAAQLADDWGWYAQAIAQLGRADDLDDVALRYPRPYADLVARASALTDVPADWLLAVMRQESLFRADAVSRANAQGLMQLLPTTASAVAYRWHVTLNGPDALFDPATAVTLGAAHLRELLDQYDGGIVLALAAYNAGTAPVATLAAGAADGRGHLDREYRVRRDTRLRRARPRAHRGVQLGARRAAAAAVESAARRRAGPSEHHSKLKPEQHGSRRRRRPARTEISVGPR